MPHLIDVASSRQVVVSMDLTGVTREAAAGVYVGPVGATGQLALPLPLGSFTDAVFYSVHDATIASLLRGDAHILVCTQAYVDGASMGTPLGFPGCVRGCVRMR